MNNVPEMERRLGTLVGERGQSRKPVLDALSQRGVLVKPGFVPGLRTGRNTGEKTNRRLDSSDTIEQDNASPKNNFYSQIAHTALAGRAENVLTNGPAHLLESDHYIEETARVLQENPQVVRRSIRAMRADLILTGESSPDQELVRQFYAIAESYIEDNYQTRPSFRSPGVILLDQNWDHKTLKSFYTNLYKFLGGRAIGTWTPHDIEILDSFYRQQIETGNHLTPLDRLILRSYKDGSPTGGVVEEIKRLSGVDVDRKVIEQHRSLLLYGRPAHQPRISK